VGNQQPTKSDECSPLGRRLGAGKATEAVKGSAVVESLGQFHLGQIVPDREQQGFEHRQRRPGRFALGCRIERIEQRRDLASIDQPGKGVERRRGLHPASKTEPLLTNRTMRHAQTSSSESP
jgi:hypothetical protein